MSHAVYISDELYSKLAERAQQAGQPLDAFVEERLASEVTLPPITEEDEEEDEGEYDPAMDPLAPFIGAFEFDDDPGWMERHDEYFAAEGRPDVEAE